MYIVAIILGIPSNQRDYLSTALTNTALDCQCWFPIAVAYALLHKGTADKIRRCCELFA